MNKLNKYFDNKLKIDWNLERSDESTIIFYYSSEVSEKAKNLFHDRVKDKKYFKIFNNLNIEDKDIIPVDENYFHSLMKEYCDFYFPEPKDVKKIAITGTNGKTTSVDFIRQLLLIKDFSVLTIGTMGVYLNDKVVENFNLTSPHFIDFRKTLHKYNSQFEFLVVEASSHAIEQKRQFEIVYDQIGWTSFSQDHLDYHQTMENYFNAKLKLQDQCQSPFVVSNKAGNFIKDFKNTKVDFDFKIRHSFLKLKYNLINLDIASGILKKFNIEIEDKDVNKLSPTPGRFNVIEGKDQKVIVDFAHTPESLESVLLGIKDSFEDMVVCVFGCGGNRDKGKRPLMGQVAEKYSDYQIVTTDNPRFEKPEDIIDDILEGMSESHHINIVDRKEAIEYAIENFPKSIILIAGKGHENYIDSKGAKKYFSDAEVAQKKLNA